MLSHFTLLLSFLFPIHLSGPTVHAVARAHSLIARRPSLLCSPQNPGIPSYSQSMDVSSYTGCNAINAFAAPWSGALSPDGNYFYMSLSGSPGGISHNCLIAKVDVQTNQVVSTISVGLFPEEIAFTKSGGAMLYGFVTSSSGNSVSVFDSSDSVVATIPLPDTQGFGTCYPFGIVTSPNQSRVYVGTLDGSGDIYAINTQTLSLVPSETLQVTGPAGHGRMAFHNNTLIVPVTEYDPFFSFSIGKVVFVNPSNPSGAVTVVLPTTSTFPSPQDVAVRCDGRAYVAGLDLGSEIFVLDAVQKTLLHTIPSTTVAGYHQGIGLSSRGLLSVADLATNEVAFFNAWNEQWINTIDVSALPQPSSGPFELVFSKDGKKLIVPNAYSDTFVVFQIP